MSSSIAGARRLYDAMAAQDPQAILAALTPDFIGHVSDGMPLGVGGRHDGREAMLQDVWAPVFGVVKSSRRASHMSWPSARTASAAWSRSPTPPAGPRRKSWGLWLGAHLVGA